MKKSLVFWIASFCLTLVAAYYQRVTGPTYPLKGSVTFEGYEIPYKFDRSFSGEGNATVSLQVSDESIVGVLKWRRYKSNDHWMNTKMDRSSDTLFAELPHQPPAGKLEYQVLLTTRSSRLLLPEKNPVILRFKGDVPLGFLIPHVIAMFVAMLLSTRTAFECFNARPEFRRLSSWTLAFLALGGMVLGPIIQKYAFGEFWTGVPFGTDLTDNKTLIAFVVWIAACIASYKSKKPAPWIMAAALITFIVFLIPHSLFGSELDYAKDVSTQHSTAIRAFVVEPKR
jgi:hypothetical protein